VDHLREQQRIKQVPIPNPTNFTENESEENIDANDLSSCLWQAVAKLPERCRIAFEYSRIDRLTYSQISIEMGISQKAVEALISRSLKILRAKLIDFLSILVLFSIHQILQFN
jgi:RNA polymerase sigma-70 factor (ECF subfamily)